MKAIDHFQREHCGQLVDRQIVATPLAGYGAFRDNATIEVATRRK